VLTIAGAAGLTACVLAAFTGMRDIMRTDGGSCASGGWMALGGLVLFLLAVGRDLRYAGPPPGSR
jgi:hypothetical protein